MDLSIIAKMYIPIVLAACLVIGYVLKKWIPTDNKWIPTILAIAGAILGCWAYKDITMVSVFGGAVTGLASTGLHQAFKQLIDSGRLFYNDEATVGESRDDIELKDDSTEVQNE